MCDIAIDIGGGTLKIGNVSKKNPISMENSIIKAKSVRNQVFIGDEIEECSNLSGLFFYSPFKKGYINDWIVQKQILDYALSKVCKETSCAIENCSIFLSEPCFNFAPIRKTFDEIFFEDYQVRGLLRATGAYFADFYLKNLPLEPNADINALNSSRGRDRYSLLIESGHSFTHIIPCRNGLPVMEYVKRLDIGGKVLTNRLLDIVSYRQLDVRSELYVMNQCKEDVSFISCQFNKDLEISKKRGAENHIALNYILPDFVNNRRGHIQGPDEAALCGKQLQDYVLRLSNERFTVPELLFHPSDVGFQEMGLSEAILHTVEQTPIAWHPYLYANIFAIGGNARMPGIRERIYGDIRAEVADDFPVRVTVPEEPQWVAWRGAASVARNERERNRYYITKAEYDEMGHSYCAEKFP